MNTSETQPSNVSTAAVLPSDQPSFYDTPNPSEHYDPARTSRFQGTRTVEEIAGSPDVALNARYTSSNYQKLYNVSTRNAKELFAYGGYVSEQGWFPSLMAFEHYDSGRSHVSPEARFGGSFDGPNQVTSRSSVSTYPTPYNLVYLAQRDTAQRPRCIAGRHADRQDRVPRSRL